MQQITGNLITLLPLILIIILVLIDPIQYNTKRNFLFILIVTAVESILEIITILNTKPTVAAATVSAFANALGFALAPLVGYLMLSMIIKNTKFEKYKTLFTLPLIFNAILAFGSPWFHWVFTVTPENQYFRAPLFFVQLLINIFYIIFFICIDFSKIKTYMPEDFLCRGISYLLVISSLIFQVIFPELLMLWGTISICLLFHYINLQAMLLRRDPLTMVFNRLHYDNFLIKSNGKKGLSIVIIDLNMFKVINDTFGHIAGDELLYTVAQTIENHFEKYGHTYRIGGDEFAVISSNLKKSTIENLLSKIEEELMPMKKKFGICPLLSYGSCVYNPELNRDIYAAIKAADQEMYINKHSNKTKKVYFSTN